MQAAFLHVDCDIYSSTKCVFDTLGPHIAAGAVVVFDDLFNYPTFEKHEVLAFHQFLENDEFNVEWIGKHGRVFPELQDSLRALFFCW